MEEGEYVKAGQVLTRLEDDAQRASLAQAQAQVMAARALLGQFLAQLAQARRDLKRSEDLVARQLVSAQTIEVARTEVETYEAQVESQQKQVELARALVQGAEVQLKYTTVLAPFSGVIVDKTAQAGEIVSPMSAGGGFTRTGIGTIVDMSSLEIEVDVNEAYINRIQPGQRADAVLDAYPNWTIPAHVIAIIPTADRSKATVKVRVAIDKQDSRILPDMGARVSFHKLGNDAGLVDTVTAERVSAVLVPNSAIVERNGRRVVFTVADDRAQERGIVLGKAYGDLRFIKGIPKGARVVREPPADLHDQTKVQVTKQH
jgi:RND family efflux transporter MFP subunit